MSTPVNSDASHSTEKTQSLLDKQLDHDLHDNYFTIAHKR